MIRTKKLVCLRLQCFDYIVLIVELCLERVSLGRVSEERVLCCEKGIRRR